MNEPPCGHCLYLAAEPAKPMCKLLAVSRSGFSAARKRGPSKCAQQEQTLVQHISNRPCAQRAWDSDMRPMLDHVAIVHRQLSG
jgi:hypothetical protein